MAIWERTFRLLPLISIGVALFFVDDPRFCIVIELWDKISIVILF